MRSRIRAACDGLGWFIGPAIILAIFSLLWALLISQSPYDRLQWTGARVVGDERQGLVFYTYDGQRNTLDVHGFANNPHYIVYVNKSDPTDAVSESRPTRILDIGFVLAPLVLAAGLVMIGVVRRGRQRRRSALTDFGHGLDNDFVQRKLNEIRGNLPNS